MNRLRAGVGLLVCAMCAAGIMYAEGRWFAAALPLAAWLIIGAALVPALPELEAERSIHPPMPRAGEETRVMLRIRNRGQRIDLLRLGDGLPDGASLMEGSSAWRGSLESGASVELRYSLSFPRGDHEFTSVAARAESPLWSSCASAAISCPGRVTVPPAIMKAPVIVAGPAAVRPFAGVSGARRPGEGSEFYGTRDYVPGDRLRSLNWRAGALWGQSVVNVFEGARAIDAGIILDCRAEAYRTGGQFEAACSAALSCAESFLDGGNRVGFLRYGAELHWVPPGAGRDQRLRLRSACASAALGDHAVFERFDRLPVNVFPPRSLVLLVSPLLRDDLSNLRGIRALGYEVVALRVDQGSEGAINDGGPIDRHRNLAGRVLRAEADIFLARLIRSGIAVLSWDMEQPFHALRPLGGRRS